MSSPNVDLSQWLVNAYTWLRENAGLQDAPQATGLPEDAVRIFVGFPKSKKVKGELRLSEVHFGCIEPASLRGVDMIVIHPAAFVNPVVVLKELLLGVIRVSLPADVKNKKPFQAVAGRLGFAKPWAMPDWDDAQAFLHEAWDALGNPPAGHYVEPLKEEKSDEQKASEEEQKKKELKRKVSLFCQCDVPEPLQATVAQLQRGLSVACLNCKEPYEPQEEIGVAWEENAGGGRAANEERSTIGDVYSEDTAEIFDD